MKKLLVVLMIWLGALHTQTVNDLYRLPVKTVPIQTNGTNYLGLDLYNAQIVSAKAKIIPALEHDLEYLTQSLQVVQDKQVSTETDVIVWKFIALISACIAGVTFIVK